MKNIKNILKKSLILSAALNASLQLSGMKNEDPHAPFFIVPQKDNCVVRPQNQQKIDDLGKHINFLTTNLTKKREKYYQLNSEKSQSKSLDKIHHLQNQIITASMQQEDLKY